MHRSVAVVGGGIGGLTAAVALLRAGLDVRVYEQARALPRSARASSSPRTARASSRRLGAAPGGRAGGGAAHGLRVPPVGRRPAAVADPARRRRRDRLRRALPARPPRPTSSPCWPRRCRRSASRSGGDASGWRTRGQRAEVVFADGSRDGRGRGGRGGRHPLGRAAGAVRGRAAAVHRARGLPRPRPRRARLPDLGLERRCTVRLGPGAHFVHYFVGAGRLLNVVCVAEEDAWRRESWTDRGGRRRSCGRPSAGGTRSSGRSSTRWTRR